MATSPSYDEQLRRLNEQLNKAKKTGNTANVQRWQSALGEFNKVVPNAAALQNLGPTMGAPGADLVRNTSPRPSYGSTSRKTPTDSRPTSRPSGLPGPAGTTVSQPTVDRQFNLTDIQNLMQQVQGVGQTTDRFGTPDQLVGIIQELVGQMQPLTAARTEAHDVQGQELMRGLGQEWAGRGMLASGGAMSQERQAAADLARQRAGIQAEAQAEAIPLALQYGELGLREDEYNRRFLLDRLMGTADVGLRGYGLEEGTRQFDEEMAQRASQFEREMELGVGQLTGMFRDNPTLAAQQFGENIRQFERTHGLREGELLGQYQGQPTLAASQFEREMGLREGQLMGIFNDQPTLAAREFGENIRQFEKTHGLREGELLGYYQGNRTLGGQQLDAQRQYWQGQLANQSRQIAQSAANARFDILGDLMRTTGMTPEDLSFIEEESGFPPGSLGALAGFDANNASATEEELGPLIDNVRRAGIGEDAAVWMVSEMYPPMGSMMEEEYSERGTIETFSDPEIMEEFMRDTIQTEADTLREIGDVAGARALERNREKMIKQGLKDHGLAVGAIGSDTGGRDWGTDTDYPTLGDVFQYEGRGYENMDPSVLDALLQGRS